MKYYTLFALLIGLVYTDSPATAEQQKPNVIVIITDDQGYGDMSVHGNPFVNTPNIDQLAHESTRLDNFHVDPTCSPTRAALMTGRYATRSGVWLTFGGRNHLYREETTMADVFKHNDYKTAIFGKWHLGDNYPFRPQDRGFDYSFIHKGGVAGETPDYWGNNYFDDTYFENNLPVKTKGYSGDIWFQKTEQFITENKNEPFFIYLATNTPHGPFNIADRYSEQYRSKGIPEKRSRFYGMINNIDENIGQLRATLDKLQLADNTIIVYLTDNGTSAGYEGPVNGYPESGFNAGMRGRKTSAYEGGHRAAGFISWPDKGLNKGKILPLLTAHIDILPTFIDVLNLKLNKKIEFDGSSLSAALFDSEKHPKTEVDALNNRTLLVHNQARFGKSLGDGWPIKGKDIAVMTNRWRLVGDELFDMNNDPAQKTDVAKTHPKVVNQLKTAYEDWWNDITRALRDAPTVVNPQQQKHIQLSSQAWRGDRVPYDQQHVRSGFRGQGYWDIDVEETGTYTIELARWPKESNLTFTDRYKNPTTQPGLDQNFTLYKLPEQPFVPVSATLYIDGKPLKKSNKPSDRSVTFSITLTKGLHTIEGRFTSKSGEENGAYFVYINASK